MHREGETVINWMAFRDEPVFPYDSLISNYGKSNFDKRSQERAVNQYFTFDELKELAEYLTVTRGWNLKYREIKIPRDFHVPLPIYPPESAVLLCEEAEYELSVDVVGSSSLKMLPGLLMDELDNQAGQRSFVWSMFYFEELLKKLGIGLSDKGIFSNENLLRISSEIFYESGFYIHKFGEKDSLAEITPQEHIARIEKNKELKLQIEKWNQQQSGSQDNDDSDIEGDDDF